MPFFSGSISAFEDQQQYEASLIIQTTVTARCGCTYNASLSIFYFL